MTAQFLLGFTTCGCLVIAVFFVRFWRASGDRFFGLFAAAFAIFAANRIVLASIDESSEARPAVYVVRLLAFVVILGAIVDKNRREA